MLVSAGGGEPSATAGHFEQFSPAETACVLGIKQKTAAMRYMRALWRLKEILSSLEDARLEA
jgi:DNA-directed RNA polymerase specialized sigma24 family protein